MFSEFEPIMLELIVLWWAPQMTTEPMTQRTLTVDLNVNAKILVKHFWVELNRKIYLSL